MKFRLNALLLAGLACSGLWSCGNKGGKDKNGDEFNNAEKTVKEGITGIERHIPRPSEIPYLLQATGADFNQSLVNDRRRAGSYESQSDVAALNLGVYTADIGYLSSYGKTQESIDYLNVCKSLADKLGIIGSYDRATLEEFEKNIANKDKLAVLLDDAMKKSDQYLRDGNKSKLAALMITGSFIEGLYISTGIVKSFPSEYADVKYDVLRELMLTIIKQKESVGEVIKLLSSVEQTGPIPTIVMDLKSLETSYNALHFDEQVKNNKGGQILSDKTLGEITGIVERIRGDIVQ